MTNARKQKPVLGWREWVTLRELCDVPLKAKVDTGARTSALHAFDLEVVTLDDGGSVARFEIHPLQRSTKLKRRVEVPVVGFRTIRSSNGQRETRPVIHTDVEVGPHRWGLDLTLTSRDEMGFRMLLGRAGVRRRFLVDPGSSYRQGGTK